MQETIKTRLAEELRPYGFDIISRPFQVSWYNVAVLQPELHLPLLHNNEQQGVESSTTVGILIGNSKRIWEPFLCHLHENGLYHGARGHDYETDKMKESHPIDAYTMEIISSAVARIFAKINKSDDNNNDNIRYYLRWAHEVTPGRLVAMQTVAHVSRLAYYDRENSFLCIHPVYGTWFALRAVLVFNMHAPPLPEPAEPFAHPCPECAPQMKQALELALKPDTSSDNDSDTGSTSSDNTTMTCASVRGAWRKWVKMRDACPIGRDEHRYSEEQIEYHYTHNKAILQRCVRELSKNIPCHRHHS